MLLSSCEEEEELEIFGIRVANTGEGSVRLSQMGWLSNELTEALEKESLGTFIVTIQIWFIPELLWLNGWATMLNPWNARGFFKWRF